MRTELISEVMDEDRIGLKVRLDGHVPRSALQRIGETWARSVQGRAERVWVWLYGRDMDTEGPALSVTYIEGDGPPVSDFAEPSTLLLYYMFYIHKHDNPFDAVTAN